MTFLLNESSLGLQLFKLNKLDKLSLQDPKIYRQFDDFQHFKTIVSLEGTFFFHGHGVAVQTVTDLKQGVISPEIIDFVQSHLPSHKKDKTELALIDKSLAPVFNSKLGVKCLSGDMYIELFRGIRTHLAKFLISDQKENVSQAKITQANLGLGHAVARNSIKYDEKKQDKTIINTYCLLEQMEKNLNTFSMRIKEGYSWHFPELAKIVPDNEAYVKLVALIGNKLNIKEIDVEEITQITGDEDLTNKIIERTQSSVGNSLGDIDEQQLKDFANYTIKHFEYKKDLQEFIRQQMMDVAPNLTTVLGESVGAKMLTHSGGLSKLAKMPSSTI